MNKNIVSILLSCLLLACSSNNNNNKQVEIQSIDSLSVINLSENVMSVSSYALSEAVEKVDIVELEVSDESLLGEIRQLEVSSNDIWVTSYKDELIYRFNHEGKFLNKVGKKGQGAGEYVNLWNFAVDDENKQIYVLTASMGVFLYDYAGNFIRKVTSSMMNKMFQANEQRLQCVQQRPFLFQNLCLIEPINNLKDSLWSIALLDKDFNKTKIFKNPAHLGKEELLWENRAEYIGWKNYWAEIPTRTDFYGGQFTMKYPDTDTIYCYKTDIESFVPLYPIACTEPRGNYGETHQRFKTRSALSYFRIQDYKETKSYVYLKALKGEKVLTYAYNRESGQVRVVEQSCKILERKRPGMPKPTLYYADIPSAFVNDFMGGQFQLDYASSGKYWVDVFNSGSDEVDEMIAVLKKSTNERSDILLKSLTKMNEDSNPLLLIATLK